MGILVIHIVHRVFHKREENPPCKRGVFSMLSGDAHRKVWKKREGNDSHNIFFRAF